MAANKTQPTLGDVNAYIKSIDHKVRQRDACTTLDLMKKVTGAKPVLWGASIIGFGHYHYKYDSGREGDFFITGFSPRKTAMTLYIMQGFREYGDLLAKLGKHKIGRSCLYINKFEDIDLAILEEMVKKSADYMFRTYDSACWEKEKE